MKILGKEKNRNSKCIWIAVIEVKNRDIKSLFEVGDRDKKTFLKSGL